ncbi:deoxyribodipyrimidine photo-lyase [Chitinispirillales bacterium ANBcel5]|uniref:deoxyribodipyrimidine photo-lyase n=1 Tax=Cellulosispirillum alkaliphilum TaxID=3039283 RepID=UPI002A543EF3|nr:deoxyribodipyrimidine photo-lyase [Chitinispirillales bacterium ANBcel5]
MVQSERVTNLNANPLTKGKYVLYWMQQSQRVDYNHALEFAAEMANKSNVALVVFFAITPSFPEANLRHYYFMLSGIAEIYRALQARGIQFVVRIGDPIAGVVAMAKESVMLVTDCGYTSIQRSWRRDVAKRIDRTMIQVESDVVVPVTTASEKEEVGARTIRSKINRHLHDFLTPLKTVMVSRDSLNFKFDTVNVEDISGIIKRIKPDESVTEVKWIRGGSAQAHRTLEFFLEKRLSGFAKERNDPSKNHLSNLSPYLHFGQISPVYVAIEVAKRKSPDSDAFIEEMVIRRELSCNFTYYNKRYDRFDSIPEWAKNSLSKHDKDKRPQSYSLKTLEEAKTHDPYWNAAQLEMVYLGKMHGYMRMYWGKKIIEWTNNPQLAFKRALYLNNKYSLDGRDPNSFTGIAWCFGKHDRAWAQRAVFGKVRYMNDNGLKRKFDMDQYIKLVDKRIGEEKAG